MGSTRAFFRLGPEQLSCGSALRLEPLGAVASEGLLVALLSATAWLNKDGLVVNNEVGKLMALLALIACAGK